MTTPVYLNTGGGLFGAIRQRVRDDPNLLDAFGDRVFPGRARNRCDYPYVVLSHVTGIIEELYIDTVRDFQDFPDYYDYWKETIQVSVYTENYEAARILGRLLYTRMSRQTFVADCDPVTIYPQTRTLVVDPQQGAGTADIWHYDVRYYHWRGELLLPDQYEAIVFYE